MAHALTLGGRLAGNEGRDRLCHPGFDILCRFLFAVSANLSNHHNGVGVGVFLKQPQRVNKARAADGVAADTERCGLPDAA